MTVVRLNRSRYSPKDATGARLHGGRWNSPGNAVLYASSTLALACLEVLVHIRDVGLMPTDYVFCEVDVPEALFSRWTFTGEAALAKIESPVLSREYGDAWFHHTMPESSQEAAFFQSLPAEVQEFLQQFKTETAVPVQAVPSVIIPREMNYLISPVHPQFGRLVWGEPQPFRFDPRLIATAE
jgi:RES domain-containing protein